MRIAIAFSFLAVTSAFGQTFDISNDAALHGDYFIREVLITGQNADGTIASAKSAIGLATFDGKGNYRFTSSSGVAANGTYGVGANGLLYIQSFANTTQKAYGGLGSVGPSAFVASATEGANADLIVAIPAGTAATAASFKGNYTAGYVSFPSATVAMVRQAAFTFSADGAGNLGNVALSGAALNLGGTTVSQSIAGGTYTLSGEGIGVVNLGAASTTQVLSGSLNLYLSADGNLFIAGTPGGYDLIVGMKSLTAPASNSTWSNLYFTGAMEDAVTNGAKPVHAIDAFYGSWNANGAGVSITHDRFQSLTQPGAFDFTFDSQWSVQASGTVTPSGAPYNITLGVGGQAFIGTGANGLYSLILGLGAPTFSGTGVYLNPLGVVNAASFAPITNPIAPGELITLFGSGLSSGVVSAPGLPLPTTLGGVQVVINGTAVPLVYVTPTQIVAQVPQAISPGNMVANATIEVHNGTSKSNGVTLFTNYTSPGVFSSGGNGIGFAAAQRQNYSVITAANAAQIGETIVLYASGLGAVSPSVRDGAAAPSTAPLATTTDTDSVLIGGQPGKVVFNGLTPGLAGLYQLNTTLVQGTPYGNGLADISTPDAYTSQTMVAVTAVGSAMARPAGLLARPAGKRAPLPDRSR
jgi:uncharacterized protein (TIGR03437 family)